MAGKRRDAQVIKTQQRRAVVMELRAQGKSERDIQTEINAMPEFSDSPVSHVTIHNDIQAGLKALSEKLGAKTEAYRAEMVIQLDEIIRDGFRLMREGFKPEDKKLATIETGAGLVFRAMDKKSRLLGLDSATVTEHKFTWESFFNTGTGTPDDGSE